MGVKQDFMELFKVAKKAAEAGDEERCVDALCRLKEFPFNNLHVLASTTVPKGISSLAIHSSNKIRSLARDIITSWKSLLYNHLKRPSSKADHVHNLNSLSHPTRDKIREKILEALCLVLSEECNKGAMNINRYDPVKVSATIESALFKEWGLFNNRYCNNNYRSFLFNIKDPKNPDFRRKILVGEIKAETVGKLNVSDMASDERKREIEEIKARAAKKGFTGNKEEDERFKCKSCGKRSNSKTTFRLQSNQTVTTYMNCKTCNIRWKLC